MRLGIVYHMPFWRAVDGTLREIEGSFARYVDSLAPYFDEVVLCVPVLAAPKGEGTPIRAANVRLAALPQFDGPVQFYPRLALVVPRLFRFVRRVDLLHSRVPTPAGIFAFMCARLLGRPSFLLVVGDLRGVSVPYRGPKGWLWRAYTAFEEWGIQWMADRSLTFANGASLAEKHSRRSGGGHEIVETRTTTVSRADIAARPDTCARAPCRILSVSRIDPRKGLQILPEVVRQLSVRGFDVELDIVGPAVGTPGARERRQIEQRAAAIGVGARVRLLGAMPLEQLLPLYRDYDLFVLPTLPGEGIPRVLLEAMAAGLPVVTTRVAGIPSLVTHERNGLLVEQPTADFVAGALERLLMDPALRRSLIANGYETARGHTLEEQAGRMMRDVGDRLGLSLRQRAVVPAS